MSAQREIFDSSTLIGNGALAGGTPAVPAIHLWVAAKKDHREPLDDPFSFAHRKLSVCVTEQSLEACRRWSSVMTVTTRSVTRPAMLLHHLISLHLLFWRQQAIKLRVHAQVVNHLIGLQLCLLASQRANYRFVELTVGSCGVDLLANLVQLRMTLLFDWLLRLECRFDLFLLSIGQA